MVYVCNDELTHYGILGMKWGIRRYQNPDGTLTEAGKKRYGTVENLESGKTKRKTEQHEREKQEAINSGSVEKVQKFSSELTQEEIQRAFQRINDEQKLSEMRDKEIARGRAKLNDVMDKVGKLKAVSESVMAVYNVAAKTYNAFNKDSKPLPVIGDSKKSSPADELVKFNLDREKQRWEWEKEKHAKGE